MKITIAGSLGNIGKPLTEKLIAAGHQVTVISSSSDRKQDIEALGAEASIGSVSDALFLKNAFTGADAVFTMTPPNMGGSNVIANMAEAGKAFVTAITESGVKRVVMLSSIGADLAQGTGPIIGLHRIEQLFHQIEEVSITYLRAGYFYTNYYNDIPMIKGMGIMGGNLFANTIIPLVHPKDIAYAVAEELEITPAGQNVKYIISDVKSPSEIAGIIGVAIGKPDLPWVEFTDEQFLQGALQAGIPEEMAKLYKEMGAGIRNGEIPKDWVDQGSVVTGKIKFAEFAEEFAQKF
ncbi:NAD(P)H-binding protein [Pedobacter nutrimenti]|uniref:NAD(P)H-binding protein n=1 Tax=Pedobacter nutrimenti TaxID=1241337 RepID=UPI00292E2088|nr:NAD(P)H-binding protein [Pedobacter nutrimenti]